MIPFCKFLVGQKIDGPAQIAHGKGHADIHLLLRHIVMGGEVLPDLAVRPGLDGHLDRPGKDRGEQRPRVRYQKQDGDILRRLLQGLQQGVLGLHRQLFRFIHDIQLPFSLIGPDADGVDELAADLLHADAVGFFMGHIDHIRMISGKHLFAGGAFHARLALLPPALTEKHQGKSPRKGLFPHSLFSRHQIGVGQLPGLHCMLQLLLHQIVSQNIV